MVKIVINLLIKSGEICKLKMSRGKKFKSYCEIAAGCCFGFLLMLLIFLLPPSRSLFRSPPGLSPTKKFIVQIVINAYVCVCIVCVYICMSIV